jgi:hypothetical protein
MMPRGRDLGVQQAHSRTREARRRERGADKAQLDDAHKSDRQGIARSRRAHSLSRSLRIEPPRHSPLHLVAAVEDPS